MNIPAFNEIVEQNDQTAARREHLEKLRALVGNVYPNKFSRTNVSGKEDTITNLVAFAPIVEVVDEIKAHVATLAERERPNSELKEKLNATLRELGNVRISGRLAVPPRVMGKAAFVHLSDGVERLQIYVRRDDVIGVYNGTVPISAAEGLTDKSVPPAVAGGLTGIAEDKSVPPAVAGGLTGDAETSEGDLKPSATADGTDIGQTSSIFERTDVNGWEVFGFLDHGDFIGVEGWLFLTNTGELSVHVETLQFLAKAMLPMPDKIHGIADPELQRRYRYADLIASSLQIEHDGLTTRQVFERRAKLISGMRRFLDDAGYIEVETPMLTPKATGAAATPFETHHNALDIPLYARIAPELYLKRLVVGGFEKVYELNRNFRNEGLSHKHNPEFTMLEFYCAYMDVNGMMDFAEEMIKESVNKATGGSFQLKYGENLIDFSKFERLTMKQAIEKNFVKHVGTSYGRMTKGKFEINWLDDLSHLRYLGAFMWAHDNFWAIQNGGHASFLVEKLSGNIPNQPPIDIGKTFPNLSEQITKKYIEEVSSKFVSEEIEKSTTLVKLFEWWAELRLTQPTFIIDYPKSISPLSKASPENPNIAERFELFINGMEVANGFSELNDPQEQYERFVDQTKERESGDHEAMVLDEDYIRALSYGMPPAAGIGIGIDRLVMLLTNKHSIRDVILFPHMRPEKNKTVEETENEV
jgi:lysyl-tRNA synthetase, class II